MTVLLTSAGIGSRLYPLTKYFNKSMLPVGKLPVISHILDNYSNKTDFIIALGHGGNHIKEYTDYYHSDLKIRYIQIHNYSGKGSGLQTTLKKCVNYIKSDFIFHVNDAIIKQKLPLSFNKDTLLISKKYYNSGEFRTVSIKNKKIIKINDKNYFSKNEDIYSYIGVAYIKDFKLFNDIIEKTNNHFAELNYFKHQFNHNKLDYLKINEWYDTGEIKKFNETLNKLSNFTNLNKLDEAIYFKSNKVIKFFTNDSLVKKRVKRSNILKNCVPKINTFSNFFYSYKYVKGKLFSQTNPSINEFKKLLIFLEKKLWKNNFKKNKKLFHKYCKNFYYHKTILRINKFYKIHQIKDTENLINGKKYPKLSKLINLIDWKKIENGSPVLFHGDLHFENIIKTDKNFKLIDWRDSFDKSIDYGDLYYDLSKIYHCLLVNHSIIKEKKFAININKKNVKLKIKLQKGYNKLIKYFDKYLRMKNFSSYKVKIITSLIFINISPLHYGKYGIFLYYLGKKMLGDTIMMKKLK